jgi:DNA repair protein RadC
LYNTSDILSLHHKSIRTGGNRIKTAAKTMKIQKSENLAEVEISYKTKVKATDRAAITTAESAYKVLLSVYNLEIVEHHEVFVLILLNRANRVLGWAQISQGGITSTVVDARIIFQHALLANATQIIISHNHPSGLVNPSEEDKMMTKKIVEAGKLLDIRVLDHIIFSKDNYYSFAEEGEI